MVYVPAGVPLLPPLPPFPLLPPPPQAGTISSADSMDQSARRPRSFLLREDLGISPTPTKATAGIGSRSDSNAFERIAAADGPTVAKVRVAFPPLPLTVTGLVLPKEHDGAGVTAGAMLQDRVTVPV